MLNPKTQERELCYVVEINDHCDNSEECFKQAREDSIAYVSRR